MSRDDYRSYFEEEEKPTPKPAGRWWSGLFLGLILGGIAGFLIGGGILDGFIEGVTSGFADERFAVITILIAIIVVTVLKSLRIRKRWAAGTQTIRWIVLVIGIAITLAFGILFLAGR
jgi:hypothetical protein